LFLLLATDAAVATFVPYRFHENVRAVANEDAIHEKEFAVFCPELGMGT
jgi:hypothetical protein